MSMLDLKNLSLSQLQSLIDNKVFENKELEYKDYSFTNGKMSDKNKEKLVKEIAAFANTNGGIIIIGMQEDENRLPIRINGAGFSFEEFDNWMSAFRQMVLSRIRPHLHGVECYPVELGNKDIAIVITVPKSYARPHSYWDGNKDEFFMRYSNGITHMDIDDLRKGFLYSNGLREKIKQFHRDRLSMILANECVGNLGTDAKFVFHIIPEWSFELGNSVDLGKMSKYRKFRPLCTSGWNHQYNADGYCLYSPGSHDIIKNYVQIFNNGIIELVEIRLISQYERNQVQYWCDLEEDLLEAAKNYKEILEDLGVYKPWHIFTTLLNCKGYYTISRQCGTSSQIDRNIVDSFDGIYNENTSFQEALRPGLDTIARAFGYSGSFHI